MAERAMPSPAAQDIRRALVIGGAGMLGWEICRQLAASGAAVRILDIAAPPVTAAGCGEIDARLGDVRDAAAVRGACAGVDVVFQTAAAVWNVTTPARLYHEVNVEGNRVVLEACRETGVPRLIFTSSMDVVVDGRVPIVDGDESLPYPARMPRDAYSRTKIEAERMMLAANGPELAVCALRPVGMYGPRDKYHLGNVIAPGGLPVRLGSGSARFSHAYSENVAHAHLCAARALHPGSAAAGQAYFICDHYPADNFFSFMVPFLKALGRPVPRISIPYRAAYALAAAVERVAPRSNFNRFSVIQTCVDHTFVDHKARRELGYQPIVSKEEAFARSLRWLRETDKQPD